MASNKNNISTKNNSAFKIAWFTFLVLISILFSRYILVGINGMLAVSKPAGTVVVEIPEGASLRKIAEILKNSEVIYEKEFFEIYVRLMRASNKFIAGVYELETNMDYQEIIENLKDSSNLKNVVEVAFTEGMNVLDYAELLEKNKICKKDEFLTTVNSDKFDSKYDFLKEINNSQNRIYKLEGYLWPDTYKFYQDEKASTIIEKILSNFNKKVSIKEKFEGFSENKSIIELAKSKNISLDKLLNIASLIQAEAANKEDMYLVSSVIWNRLDTINNGGKSIFNEFSLEILRIDSTINYPYKKNSKNVNKSVDKLKETCYNTYKIKGLPAGAICNPGKDAIIAAINPSKTDYYYYCHSKSGAAFYARTNQEQIANLKKAGLRL